MLHCIILLSPQGDKKISPLSLPSPKSSLQLPPSMPVTLTENPPAQLEPASPPTLPPLPKFLYISNDLSPHCPLTQEFLPVPPTTFGNISTTMLSNTTMKYTESDNFLDINGTNHHIVL